MRYLVSDWTSDRSLPVQNLQSTPTTSPFSLEIWIHHWDASWFASFLGDSSVSKTVNAIASD